MTPQDHTHGREKDIRLPDEIAPAKDGFPVFTDPAGIEAESMRRIGEELKRMQIHRPEEEMKVIRRVIHTTADFDFAKSMVFMNGAVQKGMAALSEGRCVITDTNMALAGISRKCLERYGNHAACFMADPGIAAMAKAAGSTRAYAAMGYAGAHFPDAVYVIGNAPTALFRLDEMIRAGSFSPSLIIAVPVGFVNVTESKERIVLTCREHCIPVIAAMGRKGGSTVAAAIMNALLYQLPAAAG